MMTPEQFEEFLEDGENFFIESEYHQNRCYTDFVEHNESDTYNNYNSDMDVMFAPGDSEMMKLLIGHKGHNFYKITEDAKVDSIWHNKKNNTIEISGGTSKMRKKAIKMIMSKLKYYTRGRKMKNKPHTMNAPFYPSPLYNISGNNLNAVSISVL
jgi:hypothetical protein